VLVVVLVDELGGAVVVLVVVLEDPTRAGDDVEAGVGVDVDAGLRPAATEHPPAQTATKPTAEAS
jgi:hypothetical protein